SVVEHYIHTEGVEGSKPEARTTPSLCFPKPVHLQSFPPVWLVLLLLLLSLLKAAKLELENEFATRVRNAERRLLAGEPVQALLELYRLPACARRNKWVAEVYRCASQAIRQCRSS